MAQKTPKVFRYDISEIGKLQTTKEGYLRGDAVITRTGVFTYRTADGKARRELRHPDDVFNADALASLRNIPITNNHPSERVLVGNSKELSVGFTGENVRQDGSYVVAPVNITTKDGIEAAKSGKNQLSVGYDVTLIEQSGTYNGERYDARQTEIRGNHLALCEMARAGSIASFKLDADDAIQDDFLTDEKKEEIIMVDKMTVVKLDNIDYQAAPEVANALARCDAVIADKDKSLKDMQARLDALAGEKDALTQEVEKLQKRDLKEDIAEAVKARVALIEQVKDILKEDNLAELSDADIKKKVITKLSTKEVKFDAVSEDYINARFDAILELRMDSVAAGNMLNLDKKGKDEDSKKGFNLDELRAKSISDLENRYKTAGGK